MRRNRRAKPLQSPEEPPIGRVLAVLRETRGVTKAGLARTTGIPPSVLSDYERLRREPRLRNIMRILRGLRFDLAAVEETRKFLAELDRRDTQVIAEERATAPALFQCLLRIPPKERRKAVKEKEDFLSWALAEHLCLESTRLAPHDPRAALHLSELAVVLADFTGSSKLKRFSWAHLANTRRVMGDLRGAATAFGAADALPAEDPPGMPVLPLEEARVLGMKASLRISQRRFPEALNLLEEALAMEMDEGLRAALLVSKARAKEEVGEEEQAIALLRDAEPWVVRAKDERLLLCARHNLLWLLASAGRHAEARAILPEVRSLSRRLGNQLDLLRLRWAEARIAVALGDLPRAVSLLLEIRGEFAGLGIGYDQALVVLELTVIYLRQGRAAEVKTLARHLVPIFQAEDVHREALAALTVFRQAAEEERATEELVERVTAFLRQARHDPEMRFERLST